MIYYTSDLQLGDQRIFDLCSRPFNSLDDLETKLIKKWNDKVTANDIVYILGDISGEDLKHALELINSLNGQKHLILGNHDINHIAQIKKSGIFASISTLKFINDENRKVCLCHYPIMDWSCGSEMIYHVYGHIHNKTIKQGVLYEEIKNFYKDKPAFNSSIDMTGFEPVALNELIILKEEN